MNNLPSSYQTRYQKIKNLGSNLVGSRATYLATDKTNKNLVVIKQFNFAKSTSSWSSFKAYERESQVLSFLQHPGIPRYLNSFETTNGFCIVQEYKDAQSLAVSRNFNLEDIKKITIDCLQILIYLQHRIPPVIHRDIKPGNILVDEQLNVYLVDFVFARIGSGEGAVSSVAAGTFGFMAPEQIYNQNLSKATDLYGLGATIICLLTGTKSSAISTLINDNGRFNFKSLLPKLEPSLVEWLEKMVEPKQKDRYVSAEAALTALKSLSFNLVPRVHLSPNILNFNVIQPGEKVTQIITVTNSVTSSILEGNWKVVPHPNDRVHKTYSHPWISFTPERFKSNQIDCSITIDTSKLLRNQVYNRQILLENNSEKPTYNITLKVQTGKFTISSFYPILLFLSILLMTFLTGLASHIIVSAYIGEKIYLLIGAIIITWNILTPINLFLIKKHRKLVVNLVGCNNRLRYSSINFINLDWMLLTSYFGGIFFLINSYFIKVLPTLLVIFTEIMILGGLILYPRIFINLFTYISCFIRIKLPFSILKIIKKRSKK